MFRSRCIGLPVSRRRTVECNQFCIRLASLLPFRRRCESAEFCLLAIIRSPLSLLTCQDIYPNPFSQHSLGKDAKCVTKGPPPPAGRCDGLLRLPSCRARELCSWRSSLRKPLQPPPNKSSNRTSLALAGDAGKLYEPVCTGGGVTRRPARASNVSPVHVAQLDHKDTLRAWKLALLLGPVVRSWDAATWVPRPARDMIYSDQTPNLPRTPYHRNK